MGAVDAMTVPVAEVFGPVWQGEGPHTGEVAWFLRAGLCNLSCEWCDTPFTWDHTRFDVNAECPPTTADELADRLPTPLGNLLVVTGGEPLIHAVNPALRAVLARWATLGGRIDVETNGTRPPADWPVRTWVVSPKIGTRDPAKKRALHPAWVGRPNAILKVVCSSPEDVDRVADFGWDAHRVWVMPEGVEAGPLLDTARRIADAAARHGFNLSLRQHVLLYGTERAR